MTDAIARCVSDREQKRRIMNDFITHVRACDSCILDAFRTGDKVEALKAQLYRSGLLLGAEIAGLGEEVRGVAASWTDNRIEKEVEAS